MISLVLNMDSRPGIDACEGGTHGDGTRSWDFFGPLLEMHAKFWEGMDVEFICYIDVHLPIPPEVLDAMHEAVKGKSLRIVMEPHKDGSTNDDRYLAALRLAKGDYVAHFDQDVLAVGDAFNWIRPVPHGDYKFVSYPCASSPDPDPDRARWKNFRWASTRAFFCRREDLRLDDLEHCLRDQEWAYQTFGTPPSCHPWTEHFLGLMAGENQVYYPPLNDDYSIFSWSAYKPGVLAALNKMSMPEIRDYVKRAGGVSWSGEVSAIPV